MLWDPTYKQRRIAYRCHLIARRVRDFVPFLRRINLQRPYYGLLEYLFPSGMPVALSSGQTVRLHPRLFGIVKPEIYETQLAQFFVSLVRPGALVLDLGAHVGLHSLLLSRLVGSNGRVVAVEPSPANVWLLKRHLAWNRCRNVEVTNAAVGSCEDQVRFSFWPDPTSGHAFENSLAGADRGEITKVRMTTIDRICAGCNPDLIKMDIEGAELLALRGAQETLARAAPLLVVSLHPEAMQALSTTPVELVAFLASFGYEGCRLDGH